mmetsp:Transcript_64375/g.114438  ORF Transcript_64375/g.114438 Transcript_64375/m.114438 type:complete len:255 (+) Transcript_64375:817-1581(+)
MPRSRQESFHHSSEGGRRMRHLRTALPVPTKELLLIDFGISIICRPPWRSRRRSRRFAGRLARPLVARLNRWGARQVCDRRCLNFSARSGPSALVSIHFLHLFHCLTYPPPRSKDFSAFDRFSAISFAMPRSRCDRTLHLVCHCEFATSFPPHSVKKVYPSEVSITWCGLPTIIGGRHGPRIADARRWTCTSKLTAATKDFFVTTFFINAHVLAVEMPTQRLLRRIRACLGTSSSPQSACSWPRSPLIQRRGAA